MPSSAVRSRGIGPCFTRLGGVYELEATQEIAIYLNSA